jgi:predicted small lipoprotein YifL
MTRAMVLALAGVLLLATVAACGKEGPLDRPGPIFGPKHSAAYSQAKRDQAAAASNAAAAGEPGQPPAQGPGSNPYANPAPPSQAPIPGERANPPGESGPHTQPQ